MPSNKLLKLNSHPNVHIIEECATSAARVDFKYQEKDIKMMWCMANGAVAVPSNSWLKLFTPKLNWAPTTCWMDKEADRGIPAVTGGTTLKPSAAMHRKLLL
ncbi:hypothetical protein VNO78_05985 [Psophocarpus tetragonolobus]|uniref:Uncharacterized protein n=1 Tax=Psophocarpus tetragonolobus TaxID=3891 RepID=A0AAN9ST30_PSOTE